jgi:hypothetical protein
MDLLDQAVHVCADAKARSRCGTGGRGWQRTDCMPDGVANVSHAGLRRQPLDGALLVQNIEE